MLQDFNASLSVLLADRRIVLAYWSDGAEAPVEWITPGIGELTGFAPNEFTSGDLHMDDIIHPRDRKRWLDRIGSADDGEMLVFNGLKLQTRDNTGVSVLGRVQVQVQNDVRWCLASFFDTSETDELERLLAQNERDHKRLMAQQSDELERASEELQIETNERQMAEAELQRTAARFSAVLDNAPNAAIQGFDREGRVQYWNTASERMFGVSRQDAMGEPIQDLLNFPPSVKREFLDVLSSIVTGSESLVVKDWRIPVSGGDELLVFSSMFPIYDEGMVREVFCIDIDVTELRRTGEQLRQSRQFLNDILNTIADPIFVKDDQHRWILLNDSMCEFIGARREDLIGKSDFDVFPRAEAEVFWEKDSLVLDNGEPNINVENFTDTEGELHIISTKKTLLVDPFSGRKTLVGIIHDITQSKRLEQELADHRDHLQQLVADRNEEMKRSSRELKNQHRFQQSLLDRLPHSVFYKDINGVFIGCNRELEKVLGLERDAIVGSTVFDIQPRELAMKIHQYDQELLKQKQQDYETIIMCADGRERPFSISKSVFYNIDGSLAGFFGVMVDISKHRQHLQALQDSYARLEQAQGEIIRLERNSSAFAMAVTASHEISQPLMVLRGNLEMLRQSMAGEDRELNDKQVHYLERMDESFIRISQILEKFNENTKFHFDSYTDETSMVVYDEENKDA